MSSRTRHIRIIHLYQKAKTGKYNWNQLKQIARSMGVSEPTVKSYLDDVQARLKKENLI